MISTCYDKCMAKWGKKHCRGGGVLTERAEDTDTTKLNNSTVVEREVQGNDLAEHPCHKMSKKAACRTECM